MNDYEIPFHKNIAAIVKSRLDDLDGVTKTYCDDNLLIKNLSAISRFAFDQDFSDFASKSLPLFSIQQLFNQQLKNSNQLLNAYHHNFLNGEGQNYFLTKYPLISALKNNSLAQTQVFINELNQQIAADAAEIAGIFNNGKPIGIIKHIKINQGDVHQNGKSTAIIEFEQGLKLVYKPRSGGMDIAFNQLLAELSAQINIQLKTARVIDKGAYFWSEFIEHQPVTSKKELGLYYNRCGMLLAVCFLLGGTDFHFENIIASGNYPVLIDIECLFGATAEMREGIYTVYSTGLVPLHMYEGKKNNAVDGSGLGATGTQLSGIETWRWSDKNTDALRLVKETGTFIAEINQPQYGGQNISPQNYLNQIVGGFEKTCKWFIANKNTLNGRKSILSYFKNKTFRVVLRNTIDYKIIIDNSFTTGALLSEADRKKEIYSSLNEFQPMVYLSGQLKPGVIDKEYAAIINMNIPLFNGNTSGTELYESDSLVTNRFFKVTPYQFTINRIQNFDNNKLSYQVNLIKSAFITRYNLKQTVISPNAVTDKSPLFYNDALVTNEAQTIATSIIEKAIKSNQTYIWNSYTSAGSNKLIFDTLSSSLYDGTLGIAVFLHEAGKLDGTKKYKNIVKAIAKFELNKVLSKPGDTDISFATGLGGLIYTLVKTGNLKQAISISKVIKTEDIVKDKKFDVMAGSAGLIMALALLYRQTKSALVLKLMETAGSQLIENRVTDKKSGFKTWLSESFINPLTGFSHGAAGIGCAMLELFDCTGKQQYKDAFYEALKFEDYYKNVSTGNWKDLRGVKEATMAWCHGAPGIGLARLRAFEILGDKHLLIDIETAISATQNQLTDDLDFYCCGTAGRIDFLIEAAKVLNRAELLTFAKRALVNMISNKNENGTFQTYHTKGINLENPSLFRGVSGIGYTFLRSVNPLLPCIGLIQ